MTDAETWTPPTDAEAEAALAEFAARVRAHYGDRLEGVYLFGSRARGDHRPDSDADVAVVLEEFEDARWDEQRQLSDIAYDHLLRDGLLIVPLPILARVWERVPRDDLIHAARRDARRLAGS